MPNFKIFLYTSLTCLLLMNCVKRREDATAKNKTVANQQQLAISKQKIVAANNNNKELSAVQVKIKEKKKKTEIADNEYTATVNTSLNIASVITDETNYFALIAKALNLNAPQRRKVKAALLEFRTKKKNAGVAVKGKQLQDLLKDREEKFEKILSPIQMAQKRFVNMKFNKMVPAKSNNLIALQKQIGMSDGEVLKYIEINELFKYNKNEELREKRLKKVLGRDKYNKLMNLDLM